jgi:hypothetical protein
MLLGVPVQSVQAQNGPDPCSYNAARSALPSLQQSWAFSPAGYGSLGYAPLTYPFGVSPYAEAAFYGPPGLAPAFGPVGPGLTANLIARGVLRPQGYSLTDPANVGTLVSLASLQQGELGTLNTRYSNGAYYQTASATWAGAYATQAASAFTILQALCQNQPAPNGAAGPSNGSSSGGGSQP